MRRKWAAISITVLMVMTTLAVSALASVQSTAKRPALIWGAKLDLTRSVSGKTQPRQQFVVCSNITSGKDAGGSNQMLAMQETMARQPSVSWWNTNEVLAETNNFAPQPNLLAEKSGQNPKPEIWVRGSAGIHDLIAPQLAISWWKSTVQLAETSWLGPRLNAADSEGCQLALIQTFGPRPVHDTVGPRPFIGSV